MESHWNNYFEETRPGDYRFIGFYHYRLQQDDFTFSFMKESNRLKKNLDNIVKNGSDEMRNSAKQLSNSFKGHREYFTDVDAFWREIELHEELQHIEEEASRSIMHDTKKVINTAIGNARSTIGNINNRLVNPRKRAKDQPDSEDIKRIKVTQSSSASASSTTGNNELQDNIYDIKDAIVDDERAVDEFEEFNTEKSGGVDSSNYSEKAKTFNVSFDEYVDSAINIQDEKLQHEPAVKWEVGDINVTDRFRNYQKDVLRKAEREGLDYENIYESLALSSIMVLRWPCPYPEIFTNREWAEITKLNPYTVKNSPLPQEISTSLHEATCNHFIGEDVFMNGGKTKLSRDVACSFNDLYNGLPMVSSNIMEKITEEEHCYMFLYPVTKPFFLNPLREYKLVLNRATPGSRKRPDLSCVVDDITILNSEIKPLKCTPLQQKKDIVKAQLRARKSINMQLQGKGGLAEAGIFLNMGEWMESFFMDLQYDGLYRSWPFLTTKLAVEKASIPLIEFAINHVIALEERIANLAENYKYRDNQKIRNGQITPPTSFMRRFPDTPQVKLLLK
ncbi:hypothetical protein GLOIN_2v1140040 [Rhizophagus irregularis DAOM 181602=DAOM 197198]|nr:hypothetical protein GLOIN_2v1140040 [Rhizophagus irregularis DAOM 181602=DAOM 197198]